MYLLYDRHWSKHFRNATFTPGITCQDGYMADTNFLLLESTKGTPVYEAIT